MRLQIPGMVCALGLMAPSLANAGSPPDADTDASADASSDASGAASLSGGISADGDADADAGLGGDTSGPSTTDSNEQVSDSDLTTRKWSPRTDRPWIKRWAPEPHMLELGIYGGVFVINDNHELFDPQTSLPLQGWQPLRKVNPDLGARLGYYPSPFFGIEAEGGVMPSQLDDGSGALPFTLRGHAVAQLGLWSVTPFVLVGVGMLGINSSGPLGKDIDPAMHFGGGLKIYLNRWAMLRLDLRDVVSHELGVDNTFTSHNLEALLGLSITLNRKNEPQRREAAKPAPVAPGDQDGDGFLDPDDQCVDEPETVNDYQDDDGCPESDRDGDGFWDEQDSCPDQAGVDPDGCPVKDSDGDGFLDAVDQCIEEPETVNGFEDDDGCPDELPEDIVRFTGNIKGITFESNKATIRRSSLQTLDAAIRTLQQYPSVRIEIGGHTDSRGKHDKNMELSQQRADSVMSYVVGMGVAEERITTMGFGPDVPIDTNETNAGRANNRRIEFRIVTGAETSPDLDVGTSAGTEAGAGAE